MVELIQKIESFLRDGYMTTEAASQILKGEGRLVIYIEGIPYYYAGDNMVIDKNGGRLTDLSVNAITSLDAESFPVVQSQPPEKKSEPSVGNSYTPDPYKGDEPEPKTTSWFGEPDNIAPGKSESDLGSKLGL